jgi:hypothetical protein
MPMMGGGAQPLGVVFSPLPLHRRFAAVPLPIASRQGGLRRPRPPETRHSPAAGGAVPRMTLFPSHP